MNYVGQEFRMLNQWQDFDSDQILCGDDLNYERLNTFILLSAKKLPSVVHTADGYVYWADLLWEKNGKVSAHFQDFPFLRGIHNLFAK